MSATTEQKVDFLLKKVGFTLSKTGSVTGTGSISGGTTKEPFAESLPSPLVVPDSSIWNQSLSIPTTPPGSDTSIVKVYSTSSAHRMTADSSVSGSRAFIAYSTYNNTSSARLTDWIDTQFGTAYVLKVYKGDPNSGGTLLPAGGSGSDDGWFFDYSSGVLNFNGAGLPSGVTDTNIYIVGYRYIGSKGVSSPGQLSPTNLFVAGISTFVGVSTFQNDLSVAGQLKGFTNLSAPYSATIKNFSVTVASKDSSHRYQGQGSSNGYLIDGVFAPVLTLTPGRTYKFNLSSSDMSNHPFRFYLDEARSVQYTTNVTTTSTSTQITITDDTPNILHYQCSAHGYMGNAVIINSNVVNSPYTATLRSGLSVTGGETTLSSATVSDLTSGRVVLAGSSGALQDNSNLTFTGTQLNVTGNVSATEFHTGASGSAIRITSNTISGPATFTLDPAAVGDNTGKVIIAGDLQVDGTTTTVNSTTVNIVDKNIQVATGAANDAAANGGGITIASGSGNKTFQFEATGSNLGSSENLNLASGKDYKINNTSVLNATTLGSGVVNSSLTNVGTLTSLDVSGLVGIGSLTVAGVSTFSGAIDGTSAILTGNITANRFTGTDGNAITLGDNKKIVLGTGSDFEIFHSGNNSFIKDTGTGSLTVNTSQLLLRNAANNQEAVKFTEGGAVEVYHAGVKKFQSNSEGVLFQGVGTNVDGSKLILALGDGSNKRSTIQGTSNSVDEKGIEFKTYSSAAKTPLTLTHDGHLKVPDNSRLKIGTGEDLEIFHTGNQTYIKNGSTGDLNLNTNGQKVVLYNDGNSEYLGQFISNAQVELFFNGNRKLETTNTGVVVTGIVSATTFQGNATTASLATLATDLAINGANQIVYQDSNNDSDVLPTGNAGQILASSGSGAAPQWVNSAPAGAIEGITIRDESTIVGTANSISTINFVGNGVVADAAVAAGIATVTINTGVAVSEGSGTKATGATGLDFVGPLIGVDASSNTGISTVRVDALTIKDEGSTVGTAGSITTINFVGSGIAAAVSGNTATVTSAGGVTNADVVALAIALG